MTAVDGVFILAGFGLGAFALLCLAGYFVDRHLGDGLGVHADDDGEGA